MPRAAKVNVLEGKVGGDQRLMSARNVEHGAVVADASDDLFAASSGGSANSLNEFEFFRWQGRPLKICSCAERRQPNISSRGKVCWQKKATPWAPLFRRC